MSTGQLKNRKSFGRHSPFVIVQNEVYQDFKLRSPLIKKLEKHLDGRVITFFTSFGKRNVLITDEDAEMLESILAVEHIVGEKLFLILSSPGGSGLAAERIVNICRKYSGNQFECVVPHMAKSAATLICFGAAKIHMSDTAELGPVDPQVPYWPGIIGNVKEDEPLWMSAEEYVRSYDELVKEACSGSCKRIEPYIQQLNRYDSRYIEQLRSAQSLAKSICVRLLASGMLSGTTEKDIETKMALFLSQQATSAHGRMIQASEAEKCGLKIAKIGLQSQLWHDLWELYVRSDWTVSHRCGKIIEMREANVVCA